MASPPQHPLPYSHCPLPTAEISCLSKSFRFQWICYLFVYIIFLQYSVSASKHKKQPAVALEVCI